MTGPNEQGPTSPDGRVPHADDLELARAALRGSEAARHRFAERMNCVPKMLAVRNARMGSPFGHAALEDLVQDTLVDLWRRLESYAGRASLETWAYRFCQFELSNRLRKRARRGEVTSSAPAPEELAPAEPPPEPDFESVYAALDCLQPVDTAIVRARHFDGLPFEQIGSRVELSTSRVKARYYAAIERLRGLLGGAREEVRG